MNVKSLVWILIVSKPCFGLALHRGPLLSTALQNAGNAVIDYSAAAEYIQAHYGIRSYFSEPSIREECIFDARCGVPYDNNEDDSTNHPKNRVVIQPPKLDESGFELFSSPTKVTNFSDMQQISSVYLQELRDDLIPRGMGISKESSSIESIIFWHPMLRGEGNTIQPRSVDTPSTAGVASMVHMDTDVSAYGLKGILDLVRNNRIVEPEQPNYNDDTYWEYLYNGLKNERKRFVFLNIWRPLHVVKSSPLGILATRYENGTNEDNNNRLSFFPNAVPCWESTYWYYFSKMQPKECLIFKQFDRNLQKPSDFWHCALNLKAIDSITGGTIQSSPRKSFDVKAMVILNEKVPNHFDRLAFATRPGLTLEESGDFCNSQSAQRKRREDKKDL